MIGAGRRAATQLSFLRVGYETYRPDSDRFSFAGRTQGSAVRCVKKISQSQGTGVQNVDRTSGNERHGRGGIIKIGMKRGILHSMFSVRIRKFDRTPARDTCV